MGLKLVCPLYLKDTVKVATPETFHMRLATFHVVFTKLLTLARLDRGQVSNCLPKRRVIAGSGCGLDFRPEIIGHVETRANKKLAAAFLRKTEFDTILNLGMDAITNSPGLLLHPDEVLTSRCRTYSQNVFHYENFGLKKFDVSEKLLVQVAAGVFL
jgi:hypothetical protein